MQSTRITHNFLISLQAICSFGLVDAFPSGRDQAAFQDITIGSGVPESHVRRILRHAMTHGIFWEPQKGIVAHTSASIQLVDDPAIRE